MDAFVEYTCALYHTDNDAYHTVEEPKAPKARKVMNWKMVLVEPLNSVQKTLNVGHANYGIELFTSGWQCPQRRFYIYQIFWDCGEEATYDSDIDE